MLAPGHNTNIQTILGKDDHTYAKPWTDNQTTLTQTKILCIDEKGVQVMTETGMMSTKGSIVCVIIHPCFFLNMCIALPFILIVSNFNIIRTKL